jgi:cytoskeletal protein CcmA (bactofilin family)
MFSKGNSKPAANGSMPPENPKQAVRGSSVPSIISADLKITGDVVSSGDIQIDGHIEGDVQSRSMTIGEHAQVRGGVTAESIKICGIVTGQVKANNVTITKTARVLGDVLHQVLGIEPGATVEGHCRRIDSQQPAPEAKPAAAPKEKPAKSAGGIFQTISGAGSTS